MRIGLVYPQTEYPPDAAAIREYAQTAEALGFTHVLAYDHILGANPDRPGGWPGPYTYRHPFQEPLVLFSYLAGITQRLAFATGIIILPQRQTALFAKQCATLDLLSGGRLRVGVGLGWNAVEYKALNVDFHQRGKIMDEQIEVLRRLWTEPLVRFQGRYHTIPDAGLNPLPQQQPIPLWFGGSAEPVLQRAARYGAGWMPTFRLAGEARPALERLRHLLRQAGRDPAQFGIEARLHYGQGDPAVWRKIMADWQAAGATHLSFNTMDSGFTSPSQHLQAIRSFAGVIG